MFHCMFYIGETPSVCQRAFSKSINQPLSWFLFSCSVSPPSLAPGKLSTFLTLKRRQGAHSREINHVRSTSKNLQAQFRRRLQVLWSLCNVPDESMTAAAEFKWWINTQATTQRRQDQVVTRLHFQSNHLFTNSLYEEREESLNIQIWKLRTEDVTSSNQGISKAAAFLYFVLHHLVAFNCICNHLG